MADPVLVKTADQVREDFLTEVEARSGINDKNVGAVLDSIGHGLGVEVEHLAYQVFKGQLNAFLQRATGTALDNHGADWGLTRRSATKAVGSVSVTHSATGTVLAGTKYAKPATVSTSRIEFEVTGDTSVTGSGTTTVPVRSVLAGSAGNVSSSTVTEIVTANSVITAVTNPGAMSGGQDQEDDDSFRQRILAHIEGLSKGTPVAIVGGALNFEVAGVTLARAMDASQTYMEVSDLDLTPFSDTSGGHLAIFDSAGNISEVVAFASSSLDLTTDPHRISPITRAQKSTSASAHSADAIVEEYIPANKGRTVASCVLVESPGHVDAYIDDGETNGTDAELVTLVQGRLRGDGVDRNPGFRPAGVTLNCSAASRTTVNVTATITGTASTAEVKTAVEDYLNNRKVGETVYAYEVAAVISSYPGVDNLSSLTIQGTAHDGTSSADVSIGSTGIAYAGTVTIS
jgi:uncharacterized phage protein gp47/JayE